MYNRCTEQVHMATVSLKGLSINELSVVGQYKTHCFLDIRVLKVP